MQTIQKARLRSGQFAPGQSGNPGGRPKDERARKDLVEKGFLEVNDTVCTLKIHDAGQTGHDLDN